MAGSVRSDYRTESLIQPAMSLEDTVACRLACMAIARKRGAQGHVGIRQSLLLV